MLVFHIQIICVTMLIKPGMHAMAQSLQESVLAIFWSQPFYWPQSYAPHGQPLVFEVHYLRQWRICQYSWLLYHFSRPWTKEFTKIYYYYYYFLQCVLHDILWLCKMRSSVSYWWNLLLLIVFVLGSVLSLSGVPVHFFPLSMWLSSGFLWLPPTS